MGSSRSSGPIWAVFSPVRLPGSSSQRSDATAIAVADVRASSQIVRAGMPGSRPALAGRDDSYRPMLKGATKSVWPPGMAGYDIIGAQDTCFEHAESLAGTADPQTPLWAAGAALLRLLVADGARQPVFPRIRRRARRRRCRIQPPGLCAPRCH